MSKSPRKRNRVRGGSRGKAGSGRPRSWKLEELEARHMLSAEGLGCPALIDNETDTVVENVSIVDAVQQMVDRSFERAAQLDKYTAEQLNSAPRWVARVKAGVTEAQLEAATGLGFDAYAGGNGDIFLLDVGTMSSQEIIDNLASQSIIKQFYPDLPVEYSKYSIPNDPLFGDQWYLRNVGQLVSQPDTLNTYATWGEDIRAVEAWETATGKGVVIAIVDDGLLLSHPDLGAYGTPDWDPTKANPFIGF